MKSLGTLAAGSLLAALVVTAGCARTRIVQAYPGPSREPGATGLLELPPETRLLQLDGQPVDRSPWMAVLPTAGVQRLALLPGRHEVEVQYQVILSPPEDTGDHVRVRSQPARAAFVVEAGRAYALRYEDPRIPYSATPPMPELDVHVEETGRWMAGPDPVVEGALPEAPDRSDASGPSEEEAAEVVPAGVPDEMKTLWQEATPEERKAMINWIFEHR